ncbi:MAG: hypothetical protein RLP44_16130 [Aggregatilineales bacterium]
MNELELVRIDSIYGLAVNDRYIFAARTSGLYRTGDNGNSWQDMTDSVAQEDSIATTAVITAGETVIAGTNGAILWSDDHGENWRLVGMASPPPLVTSLALSPNFAEDGTVFAGTAEDGVFVSSDRGEQWIPWNLGLIDLDVDCIAMSPNFASDQTLFAGTQSGIFRSQNGGKTWQETPFPMESAPVLSLAISSNQIIAGTEGNGVYVADEHGQDWHKLPGLEAFETQAIYALKTNGEYVTVLTANALIQVRVTDSSLDILCQFEDHQALALAKTSQHWLVGLMDGQMAII